MNHHFNQGHPLKDLAEFLDGAEDGFIYFSLGSKGKSKVITETLEELPYKVLWKFKADELSNSPENTKLSKWAPQQI